MGDSGIELGARGSGTARDLRAPMARSITLFGGTGNDTLAHVGGTSITLIGGAGNDSSVVVGAH